MKIELLGWKSTGLRSPDIEITLEKPNGAVARVSLIQMPNGTGKTTTLTCLRAAMDGSAERWSEEKVSSLRQSDGNSETGQFLTTLRVDDTQRMIIEMTFHFEEGVVTYRTTVGSKIQDGYRPPPEVRRYLDHRFSELLFFDGELASDLISGAQGTNAGQIIDTFYGLYHLHEMKSEARDSYNDLVQRSGPAKGVAQVTRARGRLDKCRAKLDELETQRIESEMRVSQLQNKAHKFNSEIESRLLESKQFQKQENEARDLRENAKLSMQKAWHEVDKVFPNPLLLAPELTQRLSNLVENLDKLKLPEGTSRVFFEELVTEPTCVCDRPMDENAKTSICNRANLILGDSINGFLNELKRSVRGFDITKDCQSFESAVKNLFNADEETSLAENLLENIRTQAAQAGDEEVRIKRQILSETNSEIEDLLKKIDEMVRPTRTGDAEDGSCIDYFKKRLKVMDNDLARVSGAIQAKNRTDTLIGILDDAYKGAHQELKKEVILRANNQLRNILKYNPVEIADIGNFVQLKRQMGASMGQSLSVGYVFLAGLLHGGGNQFPLVVDSPVGSLDDQARRELGLILPNLIKQMVAFVIASERQWFVDPLIDASHGDVQFLTHLRKNAHTETIIRSLGGVIANQTQTGIVLEGYEAFLALGSEVESPIEM
jgi:DNA sulfur modification protein DndD